jgi:hypothetical protein
VFDSFYFKKCPYISASSLVYENSERIVVHAANTVIDLPNRQALILACISSSVAVISFHGISLTKKHIACLLSGLQKMELVQLKLDYIMVTDDDSISLTLAP